MERFSDIGAAVIGSGFIGTVHIENLRRLGVQVRGVLDVSPELGEQAARRLGLARAYATLEALLEDPEVDAVHVTSPNQFHYPQVKQILAAGRHVICEKPLAVTSAESRELVQLAAASNRITAVNFNIRFYPLNQHAHQMVQDGALGEPRLITGHYFQDWLLLDTDWNWRLEPDKGGSLRAVGDIGSHWVDLTNFITGLKVQSVMADLSTFVKVRQKPVGEVETFSQERAKDTVPVEMSTDDAALVLLRYANGARGSVAISQVSAGRKNSVQWEVDGATAGRRMGFGDARPSLDRPSWSAQRDPAARRRADERDGHRRGDPAGWTRRGLQRHVLRALPRGLPGHPGRPGACGSALRHLRGGPSRDGRG